MGRIFFFVIMKYIIGALASVSAFRLNPHNQELLFNEMNN